MANSPRTDVVRSVAVLGAEFVQHPRNTESVSGDDITLTCVPPRGEPAPRVRWSKDNHPLKPDADRVTVLQSGSLRIRDANRQDSGSYVCIAFNIGGEKQSNPAQLIVRGTCNVQSQSLPVPQLHTVFVALAFSRIIYAVLVIMETSPMRHFTLYL